jgi:hypothetical protein
VGDRRPPILGLELPAFVKFALVAAFGATFSFGVANLSRRVPGVRVVLGTSSPRPAISTEPSELPIHTRLIS